MLEKDEFFKEFMKEKKDIRELVYLKIREAEKCLDNIKDNEECNKAKELLAQCIELTDITFMTKDELACLKTCK
ncbi:hypothetical protein SAMN02745163_01282 [Clostridium cavendishii DSM 21758]|uniref:Uncharacterized protein n=1 Tax=Clostridium cavendishii DSM 21758 TaxID=1121302 RepID=A0A1M6GGP3_9CLOT|nr:hypothetical protein [Clostridium cavendishii]SHJ09023.1 hypothetical protein SAMN02745163_01282 [Clostridium cavendishii DSM 21758]